MGIEGYGFGQAVVLMCPTCPIATRLGITDTRCHGVKAPLRLAVEDVPLEENLWAPVG